MDYNLYESEYINEFNNLQTFEDGNVSEDSERSLNYDIYQNVDNSNDLRAFETELIHQGEYVLFRTTLYEMPFKVPEWKFRQTTCQGWTEGLCPTWKNPTRRCRWISDYPCWKNQTRDATYSFILQVRLPARLAENFQEKLQECHESGLEIAYDIVRQGALSGFEGALLAMNPLQTPMGALDGAIKAIPIAIKWYARFVIQCIENFFNQKLSLRQLNPMIGFEKTTTPWR